QQQARFGRQSTAELDALFPRRGQSRRGHIRDRIESDHVDDALGLAAGRSGTTMADVRGRGQVLQHRHRTEHSHELERPTDSGAGTAMMTTSAPYTSRSIDRPVPESVCRVTSCTITSTQAPRSGPQKRPAPPSTAMRVNATDRSRPNPESGSMKSTNMT